MLHLLMNNLHIWYFRIYFAEDSTPQQSTLFLLVEVWFAETYEGYT